MRNGLLISVVVLMGGVSLAQTQPAARPAGGERQLPDPPGTASVSSPAPSPAAPAAYPFGPVLVETPAHPATSPMLPELPPQATPAAPRLDKLGAIDPDSKEVATRLWLSAEYVTWWVREAPINDTLLTTGPLESIGILGRPGVTAVFGAREVSQGAVPGGRVVAGGWFDKAAHLGAEAGWIGLAETTQGTRAASDAGGSPLLARPAINALTGEPAVTLVAFPGLLSGAAEFRYTTSLLGAEANLVGSLWRGPWFWADAVAGFRYLDLQEDMAVTSAATVLPGGSVAFAGNLIAEPGETTIIADSFRARNQFFGGQIGLRGELHLRRFFINVQGKLAIGNNHETLTVEGSSTLRGPTRTATVPGGLLAVSSNSGIFSHDEFTLIPEFAVKVGFCVTKHIGLTVGYNILYWPDAIRPGNQTDLVINPTLVPTNLAFGIPRGPAVPAGIVERSAFWAQGLSVGLELHY